MKTLYAIDGPNTVHTAHAAGCPIDTMIGGFLKRARPRHAVVAWDDRENSWRRDLWPDYKADRKKLEEVDDLLAEGAEAFERAGIAQLPVYTAAEADDLLATIACRSQQARHSPRVLLVSNDKDLYQALRGNRVFLGTRLRSESRVVSEQDIRDKHAIAPWQWPHVMALAGQKNGIPGLPKIGFKGALGLIREHDDLETLLLLYSEVKKKAYRESLSGHIDEARLYLRLLTLRTDLRVGLDLDAWGVRS